jgi:predicted ATP-binding protein involved in virulence
MSREKWQENVRWANNSTTPSNFVEGILWADSRIRELEDQLAQVGSQCAESLALNIRLENVIEWALGYLSVRDKEAEAELRKRAGMEE